MLDGAESHANHDVALAIARLFISPKTAEYLHKAFTKLGMKSRRQPPPGGGENPSGATDFSLLNQAACLSKS